MPDKKTPLPIIVFFATLLLASACDRQQAEAPADAAAGETPEAPTAAAPAAMPRTPPADAARVFFIMPADGDSVSSPVSIEFGLEGMRAVPAGVAEANSGHHHLLVDTDLPDLSLPIPKDANHIHFGDGSSSTELTLEPGEHRLQLLLGDHLHIPHDPPVVSEPITITVE